MFNQSFYDQETDNQQGYGLITQEETVEIPATDTTESKQNSFTLNNLKQTRYTLLLRISIPILLLLIGSGGYILWQTTNPTTSESGIIATTPIALTGNTTIETLSNQLSPTTPPPINTPETSIQVYIAGAVEHPGVYTLPADARIYQLLQAAGGPDNDADLAQVNLASRISDGQEIDVPKIGSTIVSEATNSTATTTTGNTSNTTTTASQTTTSTTQDVVGSLPVNVNTANATTIRQLLHVSEKTADNIINYRTEHGLYTSTTTLLNVVSKEIYNKIKGEITVS